jgi:hypothetical protein
MAQVDVKVIAHSVTPATTPVHIFTLATRYWRPVHAEVMTHRVFTRNAGSSRAIPIATMLKQIRDNPGMPTHWGAAQKGMQADDECVNLVEVPPYLSDAVTACFGYAHPFAQTQFLTREEGWKLAAFLMADMSAAFADAGYHKQVGNRLTEPFQYIPVVITATLWDNWFHLRDHEDAYPEIRQLAVAMKAAMDASTPRVLEPGD